MRRPGAPRRSSSPNGANPATNGSCATTNDGAALDRTVTLACMPESTLLAAALGVVAGALAVGVVVFLRRIVARVEGARHRCRAGDLPDAAPRVACGEAPARRRRRGRGAAGGQEPAGAARQRRASPSSTAPDGSRSTATTPCVRSRPSSRPPPSRTASRRCGAASRSALRETDAVVAPVLGSAGPFGAVVAFSSPVQAGLVRATGEVADWVAAQVELAELDASRTALAEAEVRALQGADQPALHLQLAQCDRVVHQHRPGEGPRARARVRRLHALLVPPARRLHDRGRGAAVDRQLPEARARPVRRPAHRHPADRARGAVDGRAVPLDPAARRERGAARPRVEGGRRPHHDHRGRLGRVRRAHRRGRRRRHRPRDPRQGARGRPVDGRARGAAQRRRPTAAGLRRRARTRRRDERRCRYPRSHAGSEGGPET